MSAASTRLNGKFGIFGCGSSRKKARRSGLKSGLRATDAKEGTSALAWVWLLVTTWQLAHQRRARSAPWPASAARTGDAPRLATVASRSQICLTGACIWSPTCIRLRTACSAAARSRKLREVDAGDDRPQQPAGRTIKMAYEPGHPRRGQAKARHIKARCIKACRIKPFDMVRHVPLPCCTVRLSWPAWSCVDLPQRIPVSSRRDS